MGSWQILGSTHVGLSQSWDLGGPWGRLHAVVYSRAWGPGSTRVLGYIAKYIKMTSGFRRSESWGCGGDADLAKVALAAIDGAEHKSEFEPHQEIPGRFGPLASKGPFVPCPRPGGGVGAGMRKWVSPAPPRAGPASGSRAEDCGRGASSPITAPGAREHGRGAEPGQAPPPLMNMRCGCGSGALGLAGAEREAGTRGGVLKAGLSAPPPHSRVRRLGSLCCALFPPASGTFPTQW